MDFDNFESGIYSFNSFSPQMDEKIWRLIGPLIPIEYRELDQFVQFINICVGEELSRVFDVAE